MAMDVSGLFAILLPIIILQLVLLVAALYDLTRPDRRVRGDSKVVWALIVIFVSTIGPILYFLVGREPE
jgi:Phospholipase_D-nuclease N-terminal